MKVLYDANDYPVDEHGRVFPRDDNRDTVAAARIKGLRRERITRSDVKQPPIAHHKFIVLLEGRASTGGADRVDELFAGRRVRPVERGALRR